MQTTFFASFVAGEQAAATLLPCQPFADASWDRAASRASTRAVHPALIAELRRQQEGLPASDARRQNLELLGSGGASVVVTGQQVGLFLGPLYTLHKAATAVVRARQISARTGRPCVPLFWLQTEDHDWAEIARAELFVPALGRRSFALPAEEEASARVSLAQRLLPAEVEGLVAELGETLSPLPHGAEVAALVGRHYRAGRPPAQAFAGVLAELFADEGLLFFDPRVPAVGPLMAPLFLRALEEQREIAAALAGRRAQLQASGWEEQVHTRDDAALLFFHPRGPTGPRYRLVREAEGWSTPEGKVSDAELRDRLAREPLSFSTSALLRPLVQDTLLPTAAYVGGPAEVSYFAQIAALYPIFGLELPLVAPRARLRVVDEPTRSLLEKLGLRAEETEETREKLLSRVAARPPGLPPPDQLRERLLGGLLRELAALEAVLPTVDPQLAEPIEKTRAGCTYAVGKLIDRVEKVALSKDRMVTERLDKLLHLLQPDGAPQERVHCFAALAARCGPRALVQAQLAGALPLSCETRSIFP